MTGNLILWWQLVLSNKEDKRYIPLLKTSKNPVFPWNKLEKPFNLLIFFQRLYFLFLMKEKVILKRVGWKRVILISREVNLPVILVTTLWNLQNSE